MKKELECLVYKTNEIMEGWGVQKTQAYKRLHKIYQSQLPFRVIKLGGSYYIPKRTFASPLPANEFDKDEYKDLLYENFSVNDLAILLGCGRQKSYQLANPAYESGSYFMVTRNDEGGNYNIPVLPFLKWLYIE